MKILHKLLIMGIICLLSNTTYAQIQQYSEDGTQAFIEGNKNSSIERSCFCFDPFQFGIFENQLANINYGKEKWLYEQELLLATEITGLDYFAMHNTPLGLPDNYSFQEIQRGYFKKVETNALSNDYFTKVDDIIRRIEDFDSGALKSATTYSKILDIRKRVGASSNLYGDLKYKGKLLREMTDAEVNTALDREIGIRNHQRSAATEYGIRNSRLQRMLSEGYIANTLAGHLVVHYLALDYEEAIRFMTRYMVWINSQNPQVPLMPFGNPDNIFTLADKESLYISNLVQRTQGTTPPMDGYKPPVFEELLDDVALFTLAVRTLDNSVKNYIYHPDNAVLKNPIKKYFENNNYSQASLDIVNNLINANNSGTAVVSEDQLFSHNRAYPPNHPVLLLETGQNASSPNILNIWNQTPGALSNGGTGFFELIKVFRESANGRLNLTTEGSIIRDALRVSARANISWSSYTDEDLGKIFNLKPFMFNGQYPFVEISFDHNIGKILWDNNYPAYKFFQSDFGQEAALAIADGETFDFQFRKKVFDLSNSLQLSENQKRWLIDNKEESLKLYDYIESEGYSQENKDFVNQTILTFQDVGNIIPLIEDQGFPRSKYMKEIVRMNKWIKLFGSPELGNYIELITPDLPSLSNQELYKLYAYTWNSQFMFKTQYYIIPIKIIDAFRPFVEYIILDVSGAIVIKLLEKLPAVIRSAEISKIILNLKTVSSFSTLKHAQKFGIQTYKELEALFKTLRITRTNLGVSFHHLFEQRFVAQLASRLGNNTKNWKSIVVTAEEHQVFTNAWRKRIGYNGQAPGTTGFTTADAPIEVIEQAAREIYKDYPEILLALGL